MAVHLLDDVALRVEDSSGSPPPCLVRLIGDLSFRTDPGERAGSAAHLQINRVPVPAPTPPAARLLFQSDSLSVFEAADDVLLTGVGSVMRMPAGDTTAEAWIAPSFFEQDSLVRHRFWAYGIARLLRARGLYALHAAALVAPDGVAVILAGASGSGKSTVAIGLVRRGWSFLSDDAVLLRRTPATVDALAFRLPFSIDFDASERYADLQVGDVDLHVRGRKRRVDLHATHSTQYRARCTPQALLFPRIVRTQHSSVRPLTRAVALNHLLAHSGPVLFDRRTMGEHLAVLRELAFQAPAFELFAGADIHADPAAIVDALRRADGGTAWPG